MLPAWISPRGLQEHCLAGGLLTLVLHGMNAAPTVIVVAVLAMAVAHEIGDGDLQRTAPGWPWNGLLDVFAFLPLPLLHWILT